MNYYNEIDEFAAAWLNQLIAADHIAPGIVDTRSIEDVTPNDLEGFTQCHFFAGIGGWSLALRLAGWSDDRPVWTGSCPCQPFSAAGQGKGFADERHLWPAFYHLISQRRPTTIFGEQVASPDALKWWDIVSTDLEAANYATGAADLCAAGVGAPHIRQRLYWMAHAMPARWPQGWPKSGNGSVTRSCGIVRLAQPQSEQYDRDGSARDGRSEPADGCRLGNADDMGSQGRRFNGNSADQRITGTTGMVDWSTAEFIPCSDRKARPIEPGTFPLAHGISARVGRLRGYGNAIIPQVAAQFIKAFGEINA